MAPEVVLIEGDGVGPRVVHAALKIIDAVGVAIEWRTLPAGFAAFERYGSCAPPATINAIRELGSALKGPLLTPSGGSVRSGNYDIRIGLDLYAGLRLLPRGDGTNVVLIRQNTEDLYPAREWWDKARAVAKAEKIVTRMGCLRLARFAAMYAITNKRRTVTVVHKANNLKLTEGLFLEVVGNALAAHSELTVDDCLADTAIFRLITDPHSFDVIVANNTFGDLLSGVGAGLAGSPAVIPGINIGDKIAVAEAAHGSSEPGLGLDFANPNGMIVSAALLLEWLGYTAESAVIQKALDETIKGGTATPDMKGGEATTADVTAEICAHAKQLIGHQIRSDTPPSDLRMTRDRQVPKCLHSWAAGSVKG